MKGVRPYYGKSRREIKDKIIAKQVTIKSDQIEPGWSIESADCINKLLQRKPAHRLGLHGAREVKEHIWFKDFSWDDLISLNMKPAYIPKIESNENKCETKPYLDYIKTLKDWEPENGQQKVSKKNISEFEEWLKKF